MTTARLSIPNNVEIYLFRTIGDYDKWKFDGCSSYSPYIFRTELSKAGTYSINEFDLNLHTIGNANVYANVSVSGKRVHPRFPHLIYEVWAVKSISPDQDMQYDLFLLYDINF